MTNKPARLLHFFAFLLNICVLCCACSPLPVATEIDVIPRPVRLQVYPGFFQIDTNTLLSLPGAEREYRVLAELLNANVSAYTGNDLVPTVGDVSQNAFVFRLDSAAFDGRPEAYRLDIGKDGVCLQAGTGTGLFYGLQTVLQLLTFRGLPYLSVYDEPRFPYRGLHLDVSRHFFPKSFILKLIDLMAFYKLNTFHWHLTDGAGWRIQSDRYPRLTAEAAFRDRADWKSWWNGARRFVPAGTPGASGGYYTQEEIREIVSYAADKHIRVIPEIEMPGHSEEVFVAYPELCCSGKPYTDSDFCVGKEETFAFLEGILSEVMELFPSEYIHIGGDEAGKTAWRTCRFCRERMRQEGLKDVEELQSYLIRRVGRFLESHGRKLIGWDEIGEGGLAPGATVMVWRGEEKAIEAARAGHDVVLTPGSHLYFDAYQADPKTQPEAIGGYTPVKRVYGYRPVPRELTPEQARHIRGIQGNVWSEYIPDSKHAEYMIFPRLLALAEVAWTPEDSLDWKRFKPRLNRQVGWLHAMGVNAFPLSCDVETSMEVDTVARRVRLTLDTEKYPAVIRYTLDGTLPTVQSPVYTDPVFVADSARLVAAVFEDDSLRGTPARARVDYHRGIGKPIRYNNRLYAGYMAGGTQALLDGYRGGPTYLDGRWQGYLDHLDAVVDMEEVADIRRVSVRFMQLTGPGVFQPGEVQLLVSDDGENFTLCRAIPTEISPDDPELAFQNYTFSGNWKARYVRIKAVRVRPGFLFADEIVIW